MNHHLSLRTTYVDPLWKGAIAGCVATMPMTATMLGLSRRLPRHHRYSLPPKQITMGVARRLGIAQHMNKPAKQVTIWISHFGYGTAIGAVYAPLARKVPLPSPLKGMGFGLAVWAVSYFGWLPAMELPGSARDQTTKRNAMMVAAHLVWGAVVGPVAALLEGRKTQPGEAFESSEATR